MMGIEFEDLTAAIQLAAETERKRIVAWLRDENRKPARRRIGKISWVAICHLISAIERGEHITPESGE